MGKYRATLNMPEAKRGKVAEFPDDSPRTAALVRDGHLVPVDVPAEAIKRFEEDRTQAKVPTENSIDAVKAALEESRRRAAEAAAEAKDAPVAEAAVSTSITTEPEGLDEEEDKPSYSGSRSPSSKSTSTTKKSPSRSKGSRSRGA